MTTLLIIGGGPDQVPAFERAHALGIKTIAVDYNPTAPAFEIADHHFIVSTRDINGVLKIAEEIQKTFGLDGVMTIGAEVSPTVAAVASKFKLPGVTPHVAHLTTNKCERAKVFESAGVPFPKYHVLEEGNIKHNLSYPLVIKPSDNSASRGVKIIDNQKELKSALPDSISLSNDKRVILEEFIPGDQISIEGVVINGKLHVTAIADRNYSRNDYFYPLMVEDGGEMPTKHSGKTVDKMIDTFEKAVKAVGIDTGPSKGDLIIAEDGTVYVIEVTSRLSGGGFCSRVVPRVNGINIVDTVVQLAVGRDIDLKTLEPKFSKGMCHRYYFHKAGKIKSISGFDELINQEGVVEVVKNRSFNVGTHLEPVDYANRLFYIITIAETREIGIKLAEKAMNSVKIEVA